MKTFVYLRGEPGVGKITAARILEAELGWKIFWFHDVKNAVFRVVGKHRIPRLMDEVLAPILTYVLRQGHNVIYVRPSREIDSIERVRKAVLSAGAYHFIAVRLAADRATLVDRVNQRNDPYRISNAQDLDAYLSERRDAPFEGEVVIETGQLTPQEVAAEIRRAIEESHGVA